MYLEPPLRLTLQSRRLSQSSPDRARYRIRIGSDRHQPPLFQKPHIRVSQHTAQSLSVVTTRKVHDHYNVSVTTSGQTAHASAPFCANQRQEPRMPQGLSRAPVSDDGTIAITLSITPHRPLDHCTQSDLTQGDENRNRFSSARPFRAFTRKSVSTGKGRPMMPT